MLRFVPTVLAFGFLISACAGTSQPETKIELQMSEFAYSPKTVRITAGEPVVLSMKNEGRIEHDFVMEGIDATTAVVQDSGSAAHHAHGAQAAYDVHISALPGETSILEITVAEPGTYEFFCSIEGHREAGMVGQLDVLARAE